MLKKILSLFLAVSIFVLSSVCIHEFFDFSTIPTMYGMAFTSNNDHCTGKTSGMNCCSDAHSENLQIANSTQSQKLLLHLVPILHLTFYEFHSTFQDKEKTSQNIQTAYQPPPSLTGIIVKKE